MLPEANGKKIEELSVVVIVKEDSSDVKEMLSKHPEFGYAGELIVVDSGGGDLIEEAFSCNYEYIQLDMSHARKKAIDKATREFTLIVDVDTELPNGYIWRALELLKTWEELAVIAIDYEVFSGHVRFGTSVWKTKILQKLYSWNINNPICECQFLWKLIRKYKYRMETLPFRAIHYRNKNKIWRERE